MRRPLGLFTLDIMRSRLRIACLVLVLLRATIAEARIWYIKPDSTGDAPTIQAGIDSAQAGDQVVLAPGTYTWTTQAANARWMVSLKPGVTLQSQEGAETTTLDGEGRGTVVLCRNVGDGVRIAGLTISRGIGWYVPGDTLFFEWGGGISAFGNSRPTIDNCVFRDNVAGLGGKGGAVSCASGGTIMNCKVLDGSGTFGAAAGIFCRDCVVSSCEIRSNKMDGHGGGIYAIDATISDCWFEDNVAITAGHGGTGGGVHVGIGPGTTRIVRCMFVRNGSGLGGAVDVDGSCTISDCVFLANHADTGGAVHGGAAPITIEASTFVGNTSGGSIISAAGELRSCILAWNTGRPCDAPTLRVTCTDLYGNSLGEGLCGIEDGGGNISADPQFCSVDPVATRDVRLQSDSPCAAGNHPGGAACGPIGATPVGCGTTAVTSSTWSGVKSLYR